MISSLAFVLSMTLSGGALQNPCEGLQSLTLPKTEITAAESVPAGPYSPPGRRGAGVHRTAGALPGERGADTLFGLAHRDGDLAPDRGLERKVSGGR